MNPMDEEPFSPAVELFLLQLAMVPAGWYLKEYGVLRECAHGRCPMAKLATTACEVAAGNRTGDVTPFGNLDFHSQMKWLGLSDDDQQLIIAAADKDKGSQNSWHQKRRVPALRTRMLAICGLTEDS